MSLKKIAEKVGVSVSTVSRVLNDQSPTCASKELKDRIFQAARELGYTPNQNARRLKTGDTGTRKHKVSVVITRSNAVTEDPFFYELMRCIEIALCACGCSFGDLVAADEVSPDRVTRKLEGSDGVIILGRCPEYLPQGIRKVTGNMVGVSRNPRHFEMDEVVCDGGKAAEMAISHLLELGHKKIAYIGECSNEDRYVGYCESLIRHTLPIDYDIIIPAAQTLQGGEKAMRTLMEKRRFTAVFCANDITALGALKALKEKRGEWTDEISVIAIDDIEAGRVSSPMLTTVSVPVRDMAHAAVLLLLDRINGGHRTPMRLELPCRLIRRESCFPPG